ncbi:MAG TPA: hypothetical protein VFW96_15055 [Thermomicrobiales bacterium]|nr:hypothetical protein [Thermomicrobiales bacterium]
MAGEHGAQRDWAEVLGAHVAGLRGWRADHPTATFAAIEAELDRQWSGVRAQLLAELAQAWAGGRSRRARGPAAGHRCGADRDLRRHGTIGASAAGHEGGPPMCGRYALKGAPQIHLGFGATGARPAWRPAG